MRKFEYKKVYIHLLVEPHYQELDIDKLNELGAEGWEFITISSGECLFKREIKE